jgi:hypothetical protein
MDESNYNPNDKCKHTFVTLALSSVLLATFTFGIVLCVEASVDEHSDEVDLINSAITSWEESQNSFTNLTVWLLPPNNPALYLHSTRVADWSLNDEDINQYSHYKYSANNSLLVSNFLNSTMRVSDKLVTYR